MGDFLYLTFLDGTGVYFGFILLFLVLTCDDLIAGKPQFENFTCFSPFLATFKHKFELLMDRFSTLSKFPASS